MSKADFDNKWDGMQGMFKSWWDKLTDDDLKQVDGRYDRMLGMIQLRYGYKREQAKRELNSRMAEFEAHPLPGSETSLP